MAIHLEGGNDAWIPLSTNKQQYRRLDALVISYWGRREVRLVVSEASLYRTRIVATAAFRQFTREDQACIAEGFSERLVHVFRNNDLSLWRIPSLDLCGLRYDNIHLLEAKDMPAGVSMARFKDRYGRPGLAMHVRGNVDGWGVSPKGYLPLRNLNGIIVIVKCFGENDKWQIGGGTFMKQIVAIYFSAKLQNKKPGLPFKDTKARFNFVERIVSGTDPLFRAVSEMPQIIHSIPLKTYTQTT